MLNAYSYTRGNKFSEGQRKMLYVLASRAAFSIENARLYENLVDANKDLTRANISLEENFKQTIIGFATRWKSDRYTRGHCASRPRAHRHRPEDERPGSRRRRSASCTTSARSACATTSSASPASRRPRSWRCSSRTPQGKRILEPIPFMRDIVPGCYCHHDGSGYPWPHGRQHPAHRPHRRRRRRLRRHDLGPRLPQALPHGSPRRDQALHGRAVRPRDRPAVPGADRGVPEDRGHRIVSPRAER
jgi:hypothetical protein